MVMFFKMNQFTLHILKPQAIMVFEDVIPARLMFGIAVLIGTQTEPKYRSSSGPDNFVLEIVRPPSVPYHRQKLLLK